MDTLGDNLSRKIERKQEMTGISNRVFRTNTMSGLTVHNIPYFVHDYPCTEGCCENELIIEAGTAIKVSWLFYHFMPENNVKDIDFATFDWSGFKF